MKNQLLKGKICFVTGAGKGIGRAVLEAFAHSGAIVYANDLVNGSLDECAVQLSQQYNTIVKPLYFDVSSSAAIKSAVLQIKKEQNRIDVLVNNAGIMTDALIGTVTRDLIERIFAVNVYGSMELLQMCAKVMMHQKSGSIINLSSIVGITGNVGQIVYSSSKGAIIAMTKTAAKELAPYHIRVNAIAPGMIDTDMMRSVGKEHLQIHLNNIPMGRLGYPSEIADTALFLSSDLSTYLSGQIIAVDGCVLV